MKTSLALITLLITFSFTVQSAEVTKPTGATIMSPFGSSAMLVILSASSSGKSCEFMVCKEAAAVLLDAEEYAQSGKLTLFLNQKIKDLQSAEELSIEESIDILVEQAQAVLN